MPDLFTPISNIVSGGLGMLGSVLSSNDSTAMQKEFAQNGIQWKVEDAKKAGINPLYALGANTVSYQSTGGDYGMGAMGQDITRAIQSQQSGSSKHDAIMDALSEKRGELENTILASQIAKLTQPGTPPGIPDSFVKLKDANGTVNYYPSRDAMGAGFFPGSRYLWEINNKATPSSSAAQGSTPSTFDSLFNPIGPTLSDSENWKRLAKEYPFMVQP